MPSNGGTDVGFQGWGEFDITEIDKRESNIAEFYI